MVGAGEIQHRFNRQVVVSSLCQRTDSVHSVCLSELLRHLPISHTRLSVILQGGCGPGLGVRLPGQGHPLQ